MAELTSGFQRMTWEDIRESFEAGNGVHMAAFRYLLTQDIYLWLLLAMEGTTASMFKLYAPRTARLSRVARDDMDAQDAILNKRRSSLGAHIAGSWTSRLAGAVLISSYSSYAEAYGEGMQAQVGLVPFAKALCDLRRMPDVAEFLSGVQAYVLIQLYVEGRADVYECGACNVCIVDSDEWSSGAHCARCPYRPSQAHGRTVPARPARLKAVG